MVTRAERALITLSCPLGHEFEVRCPVWENTIWVPHDESCPTCGNWGRLVKAERVD